MSLDKGSTILTQPNSSRQEATYLRLLANLCTVLVPFVLASRLVTYTLLV